MATGLKLLSLQHWVYHLSFLTLCLSQNLTGRACNLRLGISGTCKYYHDCPLVLNNVRQGINPVQCGSNQIFPLICCPHSTLVPSITVSTQPNIVREPGERANYWCEKYLETCGGGNAFERVPAVPSRAERNIRTFESPDTEQFGTSEIPDVGTTTTVNRQFYFVNKGGIVASEERRDEFPHMAAIGYGNETNVKWACGGALISEKFVLTSAHCFLFSDGGPAKWVHLGGYYLPEDVRSEAINSGYGQTHYVVRRVRHPGYRPPSRYNDLALLEIGPTLGATSMPTMSRSIHPACLHVESEVNVSEAIASGWGRNNYSDNASLEPKKVMVSILNNSRCSEQDTHSSTICVGKRQGPRRSCRGELGGPLQIKLDSSYCKYRLIGITSNGKICDSNDSPAVYTRVSHFVPWIESVVWP